MRLVSWPLCSMNDVVKYIEQKRKTTMDEHVKYQQKLISKLEKIIYELDSIGYCFDASLVFQKKQSAPLFEVCIERTVSDFFIDENGQKWVKDKDLKHG